MRQGHNNEGDATFIALALSSQTHSSPVPLRGSLLEPQGPPGPRHASRSPGTPPPSAPTPPLRSPHVPVSPSSSCLYPLFLPLLPASNLRPLLSRLGSRFPPPLRSPSLRRSSPLSPGGVFPGLPSVSVSASLLAPPSPSLDPPARGLSSPSSPPPLWPVGAGGPTFYPASVGYPLPAGSRAPRVAGAPVAAPACSRGGGSGGRALLL